MASPSLNMKPGDLDRWKTARNQRKQQVIDWLNHEKSLGECSEKNLFKVKFPESLVFLEAAQRNDVEETRRMLEAGINPDTVNDDGLSALHQACINNSYPIAKLLISHSANVNARDSELWTPLHAAATCGHKKMCQLLISKGADVLAINIDGNMPYDICDDDETLDVIESEMGRQNIRQEDIDERRKVPEMKMLQDMKNLVERGGNVNQLDQQGAAPLHIACCLGYEDVAKFLLEHGADPNLYDRDGWQATHIAVCWCQWEILELLIIYGANLETATKDDRTIFTICDSEENSQRLNEIWAKRDYLRSLAKTTEPVGFHRANRNSNRRRSISSVKRSSLREKSDISKRETKNEAIHAFEETATSKEDVLRPKARVLSPSSLVSWDEDDQIPPVNGNLPCYSPPMVHHTNPHASRGTSKSKGVHVITPSPPKDAEIRSPPPVDSAKTEEVTRTFRQREIPNPMGTLSTRIPVQISIRSAPANGAVNGAVKEPILKLKSPDGVVVGSAGVDAFEQRSRMGKSKLCCSML